MLGSIGTSELLVILVVVLLLFGSKQLPSVVRGFAKGWREVQNATRQVKDEMHEILDEQEELLG